MLPPTRPSAEFQGLDERVGPLAAAPSSTSTEENGAREIALTLPSSHADNGEHRISCADTELPVRSSGTAAGKAIHSDTIATTAVVAAGRLDTVLTAGATTENPPPRPSSLGKQQKLARLATSVVECAATRGYTVSSFAINAAVPACLAVRDAAFLVALGDLLQRRQPTSSDDHATATTTRAGNGGHTSTVWASVAGKTVSVKDALKFALAGALQAQFEKAVHDINSDFVVEVTAKAPEADVHAMSLLGGPVLAQSTKHKPRGWPGGGRGAIKRQRREEHRFPGLTVGAVKKGLANLTEEGRERMRRWVKELASRSPGARALGIDRDVKGEEETEGRTVGELVKGAQGTPEHHMDVVVPAEEATRRSCARGNRIGDDVASSSTSMLPVPPTSVVNGDNITTRDFCVPADGEADGAAMACGDVESILCDVAIRRQPLHLWGRYTKLSRVVPQTPWIKGYFSVQEAVSEPFQKFSGCVESFLHGAGREDVNVRMLGNGRPFSLELVDSRKSLDEIAAELPALQDAVNAGTNRKNAGGAVMISGLRVAGPGELPSEVQKVGEGKRKHYRCIVWVSRKVGRVELEETLCGRPELVVQQSTPLRVLHRRTLMDRPRSIFNMCTVWINDHYFQLDLTTSAGTYVKEFVHGDLGRTVPSVGSLLNCRADILQLDVTNVEDKWSVEEQQQKQQERRQQQQKPQQEQQQEQH
ncbi:unnamed protein product [Sphacelaria rigidula]